MAKTLKTHSARVNQRARGTRTFLEKDEALSSQSLSRVKEGEAPAEPRTCCELLCCIGLGRRLSLPEGNTMHDPREDDGFSDRSRKTTSANAMPTAAVPAQGSHPLRSTRHPAHENGPEIRERSPEIGFDPVIRDSTTSGRNRPHPASRAEGPRASWPNKSTTASVANGSTGETSCTTCIIGELPDKGSLITWSVRTG